MAIFFYGIDALFFLKKSVSLAIICQHYEVSESEGFWEESPQPQPEIIPIQRGAPDSGRRRRHCG